MVSAHKERTNFNSGADFLSTHDCDLSLATFERLMELVLTGLNLKICLIYLDDIIVYGGNFYDALGRLKQVWQGIREVHLKLKPSKCCLMRHRVPFLGHYMSCEGVEVDPMKTGAVQDWPTPRTVKDVRAFLMLASYYRCSQDPDHRKII